MNNKTYKKKAGTSGIQGQLYETKLISLIYFRLTHNNRAEQFSLATNRDDIGAFDDICFKVKVKGFDKPLAVFIQAKHRENDKLLTFTKTDLTKYFDSFLDIRRAFDTSGKDMILGGKFDETESFFIIYTTAKDDPNNKIYDGEFADYLNELIGTGGSCTLPSYKDEDLDVLCKIVMKEQITTLAEQLAKFICDESDSEMSMNNDLMLRYHVILALNVLDVSDIRPEGHRSASFRRDFFAANEEFLELFKNILCLEVVKKRKSEENDRDSQSLLLKFLSEPSEITTLSKLMGSVLTFRNNKLEFVSKSITDDLKRQLDKANVPLTTVYEATQLAAEEYLLHLKLKVPASFGNKDLAIRGKNEKIQKRLNHLTTKIIEILKQSKHDHIVSIDESLGDGFLQLNGGIASAVGNILVLDESSKLLKFTDNCEKLGTLAKTWYETLTSQVENLHEYKLEVKVKKFPKLSFDRGEFDVHLVRDFYSKLLFYNEQADQKGVENILRGEIEKHPCNDVKNFRDRSGLIFLKYHDEIQKLWMMPKEGSYLTKKSKIYENALTYAMSEPLMRVIKTMYNIKNQDYTFNEHAMKRLELHGQIIGTIIVSESCVLTVAKVTQHLGNKDHVVLDFEYIFKLPEDCHNTLCKELKNTTKEKNTTEDKIYIVVCNQCRDLRHSSKRLENIAKAFEGKQTIVITDKISVDIMTKYFSQASNVWNDERSLFTDLSVESQKKFLANNTIKVQGEDVSLNMIIDAESVGLIEKDVFRKIINNETIEIGNTSIFDNYEKQFYIDRRVSRTKRQEHDNLDDVKDKVLETLYDLVDDVVLLRAEHGMGKSTLLTHLSVKTKKRDPKVWIVRINISEYQKIFKRYTVAIEPLECLGFLCRVALSEVPNELEENFDFQEPPNGIVSLEKSLCRNPEVFASKTCGNTKAFELKMFQHYFNKGNLIFLFDGYDEMNWRYEIQVSTILKFVKSHHRKHKMWITTSSSCLEYLFGPSYKLETFSHLEQKTYLNALWKFKIQFKNLYTKDMQDIEDFVDHMHKERKKSQYLRGYLLFLEFLNMEAPAAGIDFPYEEYYKSFKTRFDLCESTIPCIPDNTKPEELYDLAKAFDNNVNYRENMHRMFYDIFQGNYADF